MRLCAGQPCTSCLILNNNRYAPLRQSTLHLVPHPQQQPICALRRSTLHLVPHPQQQPICAPAPVNPAPRASSSTTTDMRLCASQPCTSCLILNNNRYGPCAGQPCTSCLILNNNRYAPLRRSTLHLVPHPQQQPICALRRSTLPLVARPCTIQSNINPSINPLPGRGRWGSDSEAERGRMAWR